MPETNYSDDAAAVFAVAILGPYFVGAVIWLSYRAYQHVYNKPKYPKVSGSWLDDVVAICFGRVHASSLFVPRSP